MWNKILAVLLAAAAFFMMASYSVETYPELAGSITPPYVQALAAQEGESRSNLDEANRQLYDAVKGGILAHSAVIEIPRLSADQNPALVFWLIKQDSPDIFWVDWSSVAVSTDPEKGLTVTPAYIFTPAETSAKKKELETAAAIPLEAVKDLETDFEKVLYIHDYLVSSVAYNKTGPTSMHTAYGALVEMSAVCDGYAFAFHMLMQKLGIASYYIEGRMKNGQENVGHAWNLVEVDGEFRQIDCTWDDFYPHGFGDRKKPYPDDWSHEVPVSHAYFLISDEEMYLDHIPENPADLPPCTDYGYFGDLGLQMTDEGFSSVSAAVEKGLFANLKKDTYYIEIRLPSRDLSTLDSSALNSQFEKMLSKMNLSLSDNIASYSTLRWGGCYILFVLPESEKAADS